MYAKAQAKWRLYEEAKCLAEGARKHPFLTQRWVGPGYANSEEERPNSVNEGELKPVWKIEVDDDKSTTEDQKPDLAEKAARIRIENHMEPTERFGVKDEDDEKPMKIKFEDESGNEGDIEPVARIQARDEDDGKPRCIKIKIEDESRGEGDERFEGERPTFAFGPEKQKSEGETTDGADVELEAWKAATRELLDECET